MESVAVEQLLPHPTLQAEETKEGTWIVNETTMWSITNHLAQQCINDK